MNEDQRKLMDLAMEWTLTAMEMSIEPEIKEQIIQESVQLGQELEQQLEEEMSHDEFDSYPVRLIGYD